MQIEARPSIGTVADSFDNALAETTNGRYQAECAYGPDANGWEDHDELELATLSWVHFVQPRAAARPRDHVPPSALEAAFYAAQQTHPAGIGNQ